MKIVNLNLEDFPKGKAFYMKGDSKKYYRWENLCTDEIIICCENGYFWTFEEFFTDFIENGKSDIFFFNDDTDDEDTYNVIIAEN